MLVVASTTPFAFYHPQHNNNSSPPFLKTKDFATTSKSPLFLQPSLIQLSSSSTRIPLLPLATQPSAGKFLRQDYLVRKYSAKEIQELIKGDRNVPLIIDFYATWCGPCILMAQELEMLAVEYESNAMIVKVDTDDEYEFARDMQVWDLKTTDCLQTFKPPPPLRGGDVSVNSVHLSPKNSDNVIVCNKTSSIYLMI
uniref:thioredoxin-like protein CITRX, chloroplastic n=1 Tax=Erigeron canadensis TaxID=72917 RepID=UPI001CB9B546|nr:thioredoxin-like protein CITRX, chloroplastic [Erigeron canadensis]